MSPSPVRHHATRVALTLALVLLLAVMGRQLAIDPVLPLLVAGLILFVGLVAVDPSLVPLLCLPLLLVTARVGAGGIDLTVSDALLALSVAPSAMVVLGGVTKPMRQVMWLGVAYQLATLFTLIRNPYAANAIEWAHAGLLVLGSVIVGWALGRSGHARLALNVLVATTLVLALITLAHAAQQYAAGDFEPVEMAWPYKVQKNAIGTIFSLIAVALYVRPVWMRWRRGWALLGFWTLAVALVTTQSRQSILALAVAVAVLVLRRTRTRRRSKGILLAIVPALVAVSVMVRDQARSGNEFNSFFQRLTWFEDSIDIWQTDPWFGVGLRWWYTDRFGDAFQPPNALLDTLTAAGIVGLIAFLALLGGTWVVARRIDPAYGVLAELVLLARIVQSEFDLFWVSVQVSLPFLILGICLGAASRHGAEDAEREALRLKVERAVHPLGAVAAVRPGPS